MTQPVYVMYQIGNPSFIQTTSIKIYVTISSPKAAINLLEIKLEVGKLSLATPLSEIGNSSKLTAGMEPSLILTQLPIPVAQ